MEPIVLASGSLQRKEYFKLLGLPFKIMSPLIEETNNDNLPARDFAMAMAKKKIEKVIETLSGKLPLWVFAADTIISFNNRVFGKSLSREEAGATLKMLSGNEHEVITACALLNGRTNTIDCKPVSTQVTFSALAVGDVEWYLDSGEWQGVAGAYRIQGLGGCLISKIVGSYSNVVGLPIHEFYEMLKANGYLYR
ncbi:MAG: Maf family protein [Spirochaetaceae bacterium]|jgi:septum formation protein|nr:Maf family protein [Spirochaetaceae bacterium]